MPEPTEQEQFNEMLKVALAHGVLDPALDEGVADCAQNDADIRRDVRALEDAMDNAEERLRVIEDGQPGYELVERFRDQLYNAYLEQLRQDRIHAEPEAPPAITPPAAWDVAALQLRYRQNLTPVIRFENPNMEGDEDGQP